LYRDISRRVFEVLRREFVEVEQYSIDEAFFHIDIYDRETLLRRLQDVKDKIEREVGIPVSIGVAETKTLAKYASHVAKKTDGISVLLPEERSRVMAEVPLKELWGVGKRSAEEYQRNGLLSVDNLVALDRFTVNQIFGVVGVRLWQELQGISSSKLSHRAHFQRSILHSRSFKAITTDITVLKDAVAYHIREAGRDLRGLRFKTKALQVTLGTSRHGDYFLHGGKKERLFSSPTNDMFALAKAASHLVEEIYQSGVPYKKAGVLLYDFVPEAVEQASLFSELSEGKTAKLTPFIDALNKRLGKGSQVVVGTYFKDKEWQSSQSQKSPNYTTSWRDIAVVKT
jgi:DNA polymerase V